MEAGITKPSGASGKNAKKRQKETVPRPLINNLEPIRGNPRTGLSCIAKSINKSASEISAVSAAPLNPNIGIKSRLANTLTQAAFQ